MDERPLNRFEKRRLRTRKQLQQAAIDLILENGYEQVTIQDITDRADLARATFYIHYKDKADLIWDYVSEGWQDFTQRTQAMQQTTAGDKHPLYYGLLYDFQQAQRNQELYKIMLGSAGPHEVSRQAWEFIAGFIEEGIRQGEYSVDESIPPDVAARSITGAIQGLILWWLDQPQSFTPEQMADMAHRLITKGLQTQP